MLKIKELLCHLTCVECAVGLDGMGGNNLASFSCQINDGTLSCPAFCLVLFKNSQQALVLGVPLLCKRCCFI